MRELRQPPLLLRLSRLGLSTATFLVAGGKEEEEQSQEKKQQQLQASELECSTPR